MKAGKSTNHAPKRSRRQLIATTSTLAAGTAALGVVARPSRGTGLQNLQATPVGDSMPNPLQLVYAFEAQFTDLVLVGLTPRGIRYNLPYAGQVTQGPLVGAEVQGTDYLLIRPDGVGVMDVHGAVKTMDGIMISYTATGYVHLPDGVEVPLEAMIEPGFSWPDMDLALHGSGLYETGAPELAWINRTALAVRGVANPGVGTLSASAFAYTSVAELAPE